MVTEDERVRPGRPSRLALQAVVLCVVAIWSGAAAVRAQGQPAPVDAGTFLEAPELRADPATAVFRRVCVLCHDPGRIVTGRRTGLEWGEVINTMVTKGAKASDEDLQTVFLWLATHFGKVNVNTAPADELSAVLGVTPQAGEAIVKARAQGRLESMDALGKVPGLDVSKISPDAVVF